MHIIQAWTRSVHSELVIHHNHTENKGHKIGGMSISIHTLCMTMDTSVCTSMEVMRNANSIDADQQMQQIYIIRGWPQKKDHLKPTLGGYWPIRHDLAMINSVAMKV